MSRISTVQLLLFGLPCDRYARERVAGGRRGHRYPSPTHDTQGHLQHKCVPLSEGHHAKALACRHHIFIDPGVLLQSSRSRFSRLTVIKRPPRSTRRFPIQSANGEDRQHSPISWIWNLTIKAPIRLTLGVSALPPSSASNPL